MRIPHEQFDQVVFPVAQRAVFPVHPQRAAVFVQRQVSKRYLFTLVILSAPGQRVNPHAQFFQGKGFGQIIVAAALKARHLVPDFPFCGQQQHRRCVSFRPERAQHRQSVHARHHNIQDQDVIATHSCRFQRVCAVSGPVHFIMMIFKICNNRVGHCFLVFRQKKPHPHRPLSPIIAKAVYPANLKRSLSQKT